MLTMCACAAWIGAVCFEASRSVDARESRVQETPGLQSKTRPTLRPLVAKYCVTCHNERLKTANLLLDKADADQISNSADTWERVVVQLRSRAMPPVNMPRPDNA